MAKVTFNGEQKTITVNSGITSIDVQEDLYSEWKSWVVSGNTQWSPAFRTFGGDPTAAGQAAPGYYFLTNGWRVVIDGGYCSVEMNLYTDEGTTPYVLQNGAEVLTRISDSPIVYTSDAIVDLTPILAALDIINDGVKRASLLVPHSEDI